ncbi:hypothetical protein [Thalassotalea piscium]|uniref:Uncharacterized protein n=1 Tax=Thalassotalea piscium TaxID=1230533 RepID=A0A7X0NJS6_9GAMM|nr:hypothetical protein [Thalassotalea piscium]MBB6544752.1 hypothetical protein [Thalassotalea piscium]
MNKKEGIQINHDLKTRSAHMDRYLPFKEARKLARSYQLKSQKEWVAFSREGCRHSCIPAMPNRDYDEFTTWDDFLLDPESNKNKDNV